MQHFDPYTVGLPSCPSGRFTEVKNYFAFPSVSFLYLLVVLVSLIFSLITGIKYNSVSIEEVSVRTDNVSNTHWIVFFISIAIRSLIDSVTFALDHRNMYQSLRNLILVITSIILSGLSSLLLSLSLNHQRVHRSSFGPRVKEDQYPANEKTGLINQRRSSLRNLAIVKSMLSGIEPPLIILFIIYLLSIYTEWTLSNTRFENIFWIVFIVIYSLQKLPVVILVIFICKNRNLTEGPSIKSKVLLFFATLMYLSNDVPTTIWAEWISQNNCIFYIGSYVDMIHLLFLISLLLFFFFAREEFLRNKEECRWRVTAEVHQDFSWHHFKE